MKKIRKMTARSEQQRIWGEEIRERFVSFLRSVRSDEEHSFEDRELAWHAMLAVPYLSNIASRWIDDYMGNPDKKAVVTRMAEYAGFLVNSQGFVNKVVANLEYMGLEREHADVLRSKKGSVILLIVDEEVEVARAVAVGIVEQREQERKRYSQGEVFFA